jgi:hypothetical protein
LNRGAITSPCTEELNVHIKYLFKPLSEGNPFCRRRRRWRDLRKAYSKYTAKKWLKWCRWRTLRTITAFLHHPQNRLIDKHVRISTLDT